MGKRRKRQRSGGGGLRMAPLKRKGDSSSNTVDAASLPEFQAAAPPLFVPRDTLACVLAGCVVCAYKVLIAVPPEEAAAARGRVLLQNRRPEECLRALGAFTPPVKATAAASSQEQQQGLYNAGQGVLTVGDGDFSFSHSVAQGLWGSTKGGATMTATSYASHSSVVDMYPSAKESLAALKALGVQCKHSVDATTLAASITHATPQTPYHRIVFNFPCIVDSDGADAQTIDMAANTALMTGFFNQCSQLAAAMKATTSAAAAAASGGGAGGGAGAGATATASSNLEVHVRHKTKPPFGDWGMPSMGSSAGWTCVARVVFDKRLYPEYHNRKAANAGTFPCWDARTYIFLPTPPADGETSKTGLGFGPTASLGPGLKRCSLLELFGGRLVKPSSDGDIDDDEEEEEEEEEEGGEKGEKGEKKEGDAAAAADEDAIKNAGLQQLAMMKRGRRKVKKKKQKLVKAGGGGMVLAVTTTPEEDMAKALDKHVLSRLKVVVTQQPCSGCELVLVTPELRKVIQTMLWRR